MATIARCEIRLTKTFLTEDKENTRGSGDATDPQHCVNPLTEFVLCEEFLKGPSLCEVSIIIWLVIGTSGFHTEPRRDNEHLLGVPPGLAECVRPLVRIFNDIDNIA